MPAARLALSVLLFALPPSVALAGPAAEPPADAVLADLPFQQGNETNRVLVDLAPEGGKRFVMMLDTGASASFVTPLMARSLGVTVRRNKETPYRRATRLGRDLQFYVDTRSSDTGSKTGWEYGLLGGDFMDEYVVEIDFPGRKVRFLDPKKYRVPESVDAPDETVLAVKVVGSRIAVPVELGGKPIDVALDTGAPDTLILSGKAARKVGIDVDSLADFGRGGTVLGPMELRFYEAPEVRFGGARFSEVPVLVAPKGWYNLALGNDSVIGYDVLSQFVLRIDYVGRRIWLKQKPGARITFFGADYARGKEIGAFLIPFGGAYHAYRVLPDGPAGRFGLRDGDAIVVAEGKEPLALDEILRRIHAREELTVARRAGDDWVEMPLPVAEGAP
jgi:predicted aspartyl protease